MLMGLLTFLNRNYWNKNFEVKVILINEKFFENKLDEKCTSGRYKNK